MSHTKSKRLARFTLAILVPVAGLFVITFASNLAAGSKVVHSAPELQTTPLIGFNPTNFSVIEGDTAPIDVVISPAPSTTATVEYFTLDGTATAGVDYISAVGVLTFTANSTTQRFFVETLENNVATGDETVNLILRNPSLNAALDPDASAALLTIVEDDATATATARSATPTPIFVDAYEPNNTLQTATTTQAGANPLCNLTLWPTGDIDFFTFVGKPGFVYEVLTDELSSGLDTVLDVFDTQGNHIASNDDYDPDSRASRVEFSAGVDGFYFAKVTNIAPSDPANKTYCFEVNQVEGTPTPTPLPTSTPVPGADACEYNGDFDSACLIGAGTPFDANFVPVWPPGPDNDFFRIWVKPGLQYTCETSNLSSVNDTNMILYDQNQNGLGGNDDIAPGNFASRVTYVSTYTGWLYVLVGPVAPPEYALSNLYTYTVTCQESVAATPTRPPPPPSTGGSAPSPPTPTSVSSPTPGPTMSPVSQATPTPTPRPVVIIVPLPTATPVAPSQQSVTLDLTVYFDANMNYTAELTEGVENVAVSVYDNATNELLAFGYTNEAGAIRFGPLSVAGAVRVSIPFLQFNQVVAGEATVFIRVAPMQS